MKSVRNFNGGSFMDEAEDYNGRMVVAGTGSAAAGSERSPLLFPQGGGEGEPAAPNWNPPPDGAAWPAADPEVSSSRSRFDFAGVFAGAVAGIENTAPPLPLFDAAPPLPLFGDGNWNKTNIRKKEIEMS